MNTAKNAEKKDFNAYELHNLELIAGLDAQLHHGETALKSRLQTIPNGWRDFRMCTSRIARLLIQLYDTAPLRTLKHMQNLCAHGEIIIRLRQPVKTDEMQVVSNKDLKFLINTAMAAKCTMCFENAAGIKACQLRKTLMLIAPPDTVNTMSCPYRDIIEQNEVGKYI